MIFNDFIAHSSDFNWISYLMETPQFEHFWKSVVNNTQHAQESNIT